MIQPALHDIVELLVGLPEYQLSIGKKGKIIDSLDENYFEVEFIDEAEETSCPCILSTEQFMVVWKADTEQWLTTTDKIVAILNNLSEDKRKELLTFAQFLLQKT